MHVIHQLFDGVTRQSLYDPLQVTLADKLAPFLFKVRIFTYNFNFIL